MLKIADISPESPLFGHVRPGDRVVAIDGQPVADTIDFRYKVSGEQVDVTFADSHGREQTFRLDFTFADESGLSLEDDKVQTCRCNCIFCFVHQQPPGMRKALYVKDEDFRLSFTHGNFVTLSNLKESDYERIIEQRLSPMYVSVHATDDKLRRCMLRNEKLEPILPRLKQLTDHGIEIHTQAVLCPEINDGMALEATIESLAALFPGVQSLGVVPVGLTRYREKLPQLRSYTAEESSVLIKQVETYQKKYQAELGTRFVWPADEFYLNANKQFPSLSAYEEMPQFENGVGMARDFITGFNRRRARLKSIKSTVRALFLTGRSAHQFLAQDVFPYVTDQLKLGADLRTVPNRFWGEGVTVSGLLTGQDLINTCRAEKRRYDTVVLPPNCLNDDQLFLDNLSLKQFRQSIGSRVVVGSYNLAATLREVYS